MRHPLANPVASVVLAALLLYDITHLSPLSTAGRWLSGAGPARPPDAGGGPSTIVARTSEGLEVFDREQSLVTREPRLLAAEWMLLGDFRESVSLSGFWGLTQHRLTTAIYLLNPQSEIRPIPPEVEQQARAALIDWLVIHRGLPAADATLLRAGNLHHVSPRAAGYLHNLASITALVLFLGSLAWIPREASARIRARRLALGLCPHCRYPIRGLDAELCPECGRAVPRRPEPVQ